MIPHLLFQIALIIMVARSGYVCMQLISMPAKKKDWLDILFHASVAVVSLSFLL